MHNAEMSLPAASFARLAAFAFGLAGFVAIGCSDDAAPVPSTAKKATEQSNGGCPSAPTLKGSAGAGAACAQPQECKPVCCTCSVGHLKSWLAAACDNGHCVDDPCTVTRDDSSFCK
jgi:hypothetical protein